MKLTCEIAGCEAELSEGTGSHGGLMICPSCRASSYYWKKQPLAAARVRHERLQLFTHRMEYYEPRIAKIMNNAKRTVRAAKERANGASLHH